MNVYAIHGRFGAYVQLGETPEKGSKEKPKRSSLTGGMTESTVTLDEALKLLELPRELGAHPESEQPIVAGLGRFGPYVKHGDDYRSLDADDDLFTVDSRSGAGAVRGAEAVRPRQTAKRVIRQIEATDGGAALQVLEGRYGPYVTDGETNASDAERHRSGDAVARRGARAARGAPRCAAAAAARRAAAAAPARGRRRRADGGDGRSSEPAKAREGQAPGHAAKRKAARSARRAS